ASPARALWAGRSSSRRRCSSTRSRRRDKRRRHRSPRVWDAKGMQPLESYRDRFPILEHTTYLINHSLGAMPLGAEVGLRRYAREWRERGVRAWEEGWWETSVTAGDRLARIIGGAAGRRAGA